MKIKKVLNQRANVHTRKYKCTKQIDITIKIKTHRQRDWFFSKRATTIIFSDFGNQFSRHR